MIEVTALVTGERIASDMADDLEEAAQFFPEFATSLSSEDWVELNNMLKSMLFADYRKEATKRLGELLIAAAT